MTAGPLTINMANATSYPYTYFFVGTNASGQINSWLIQGNTTYPSNIATGNQGVFGGSAGDTASLSNNNAHYHAGIGYDPGAWTMTAPSLGYGSVQSISEDFAANGAEYTFSVLVSPGQSTYLSLVDTLPDTNDVIISYLHRGRADNLYKLASLHAQYDDL